MQSCQKAPSLSCALRGLGVLGGLCAATTVSVCPAETGCASGLWIRAHSSPCLCAHVPCSVSCDPGCPCGRGSRPSPVPSTLGSRGSAPAHHSCLRASAWPHCIPGAAWPPLFPPLALVALGPSLRPGQGGTSHSQDRPSKAINRALSQPPVPVVSPRVGGQWCPRLTKDTARGPDRLVGRQTVAWRQPPGCLAPGLACDQEARSCRRARGHVLGGHLAGSRWSGLEKGLSSTLQPGARPTSPPHGFLVASSQGTALGRPSSGALRLSRRPLMLPQGWEVVGTWGSNPQH